MPKQAEERHNDPAAAGKPEEPRGIEKDIADADKKARSGSTHEPLRNTPPAGAWNDTAAD
jgi:hypothetical protein